MPSYSYKARNNAGKLIGGVLDAESPLQIAQTLQHRGQTPISIEPAKENDDLMEKLNYWQALRSIGTNDLILFCRQMHSLTKAGVPLIRSIISLADSHRNIAMKQTLKNVAQRLEAGQPLSQALSQ
ncbi:MAG: type II secretion system F family protein, partial [Methylomonas sp.]